MVILPSPAMSIAWALIVLASFGCAYQLLAAYAVRRWAARPRPSPVERPPVTLLKPLCGDEITLRDDLRSFFRLSYPKVQMVCGVRDATDPAIGVVRQLQATLPAADIALVVDPKIYGTNYKVSNLINMMTAAKHDILALSDSDMRMEPDDLDLVIGTLEQPGTGLATCLYLGEPQPGIWSELGAAGVNLGFVPSAMVSKLLGGKVGCYGATIALRRETLESVGGFQALKDQLADDYALGALVRERGLRVAVAPNLLRTAVNERSFTDLVRHELRWARTIRNTAPFGFAGTVITHPIPLALLACALGLTAGLAWPMLAGVLASAVACRLALVTRVLRALGAPRLRWWLLLPRDLLSLVILLLAYCGRSVSWRQSAFHLDSAGTLVAEGETRG
jgi:ceramide glucosyltransferase